MSQPDNLAESFGQPARSLSTMLPPRRRRGGRERADTEPPAGGGDAAPTAFTRPGAPESEPRRTPRPSAPDTEEPPGNTVPTTPAPRPADSESTSTPEPDDAAARAGSGRRRSPRVASRPTTTDPDDHASYQVVVYVHPTVKSVASSQRREQKVSNAEIAFDAIDAVQHRLDGLIKTRRLQSRPESSLFPGRVRRGRVSGGGAVASAGDARRVLWGFRATGQELAVIDRLVERSGAESRSELVATALEEVLLPSSARH